MVPKKSLVILAVIEGIVIASAALRVGLTGVDLSATPHLIWFIGTITLAAAGLAQFVVRAAALQPRIKAGEPVEEDRKQIFTVSIALLVAAALLSLAGPDAVQKLLG